MTVKNKVRVAIFGHVLLTVIWLAAVWRSLLQTQCGVQDVDHHGPRHHLLQFLSDRPSYRDLERSSSFKTLEVFPSVIVGAWPSIGPTNRASKG